MAILQDPNIVFDNEAWSVIIGLISKVAAKERINPWESWSKEVQETVAALKKEGKGKEVRIADNSGEVGE